jgi:DNA-binding NarL/FixJ family response regulator
MSHQKLIFIVDDDPMYCEILADHLTSNPKYIVKKFSTGEECLKQLFEMPDLIILDYNLSLVKRDAENGMQILEHIMKEEPTLKVVILSCQEHYGVALETIRRGAEQYIIKDNSAFEKLDQLITELN